VGVCERGNVFTGRLTRDGAAQRGRKRSVFFGQALGIDRLGAPQLLRRRAGPDQRDDGQGGFGMNLLITGALGHIGSRLIHGLKPGEFEEVVLLDNLSSQRYPSLFNLPDGVPFRFVEDDVCTGDLEKQLSSSDVVIHLAAITDAAGSFDNQEEVEKVNLGGTRRLAEACVATGCKLLFLSTTSVYGVQEGEVDEDCSIDQLQPQSPYADSKLRSEFLLQEMGARDGLDFVICRFGTIFGISPGMRFHTAVNKFCWQAVTGQPITVWRTALNQKRPYLDLVDAVAALKFILRRELFDLKLYNVLTTNATVKNIVDTISAYVPDTSIKYVDSKIMNQLSYTVKDDRFVGLGFEVHGSLEEGIGDTIRLLRGVRQGPQGAPDPATNELKVSALGP